MATRNYQVWYLDTWGNAREGYEVNDRRAFGEVTIDDGASKADILRVLKDAGIVGKRAQLRSFDIDWVDEGVINIDERRRGKPLFELEEAFSSRGGHGYGGKLRVRRGGKRRSGGSLVAAAKALKEIWR